MTKIVQKTNVFSFYEKYLIDSSKFYIDLDVLKAVNLPKNFTIIDNDTGNIIDEFKKNSLQVNYKTHKIYIATITKELKQGKIKKLMFYFPAKVANIDYFNGITKSVIIDVLLFLREQTYIDFDDVNNVFKNIYVKDLDIKKDMRFKRTQKDSLFEYNKDLKSRFNGLPDRCIIFNNEKRGFGIQAHERITATTASPFLKFYDKSKELRSEKNRDFFNSLPDDLKNEIAENFIYRFEFTLKDNKFFKKFALSNRLEEVLEVRQITWQKIARYYLDTNFRYKVKKEYSKDELKPQEKILLHYMVEDFKRKESIYSVRRKYINTQKDKQRRFRASQTFDKIFSYYTNEKGFGQVIKSHEILNNWDNYFGFC